MSKLSSVPTGTRITRKPRQNLSECRDPRLSTQQYKDSSNSRKHSAIKRDKMERVKTQYPDRSRSSQFDNEVRPDLTKLLPFRIAADKERLYAELLDVKRINHKIENENLKLKTQLKMDADEKSRLLTQLGDYDKYHPVAVPFLGSPPATLKGTHNLVLALKQDLRAEKQLNQELRAEISAIKKSSRVTKLKEYEIQNKIFQERLERYAEQRAKLIEVIQSTEIQRHQCATLEGIVIQRDQEIANIKQQLRHSQKAQMKLRQQIAQMAKEYQEQIRGLKQHLQIVSKSHQSKSQQLQRLSQLYSDLRHNTKNPDPSHPNLNQLSHHHQQLISTQQKKIAQLQHLIQKLTPTHSISATRILQFLNLRLRAHHIETPEIGQYLTPQNLLDSKQMLKRPVMLNILAAEPFELVLLADRLAVCEYLYGREEAMGARDLNGRFCAGLGQYTVDRIDDEDRLFMEICQIVSSQAQQLNLVLLQHSNGEGTISKQSLCQVLSTFKFTPQQQLFLLTQVSLDSVGLDRMAYYPIFDLFNQSVTGGINPVEELSEEYEPSNSNTNLRRGGNEGYSSMEVEERSPKEGSLEEE